MRPCASPPCSFQSPETRRGSLAPELATAANFPSESFPPAAICSENGWVAGRPEMPASAPPFASTTSARNMIGRRRARS